ncbi:nuclear transport factor 2 family protein [Cloacibacillus sp.]|uniref:nuclear transport factor 2 family protein n=1 Tax=Cloacibacillus sp. TaxID=2049023 RepID=UPI0025C7233A|nr:nuclear transport factor 2 family protein [Cloacibacillus sp.]MCC8058310.1 nuclear transport factor 2 family protein [Cloacibacillus sp.]
MKRYFAALGIWAAVILFIACSVPGRADCGPRREHGAPHERDEEMAERCYRDMYKAMIAKDAEGLSLLLDESFVLIHMTGVRQSKQEFIDAVMDGALNYYTGDHQKSPIEVNGTIARMTGRTIVDAAVYGGARHTWRLQQQIKLVKKGERWLMTEAMASTF